MIPHRLVSFYPSLFFSAAIIQLFRGSDDGLAKSFKSRFSTRRRHRIRCLLVPNQRWRCRLGVPSLSFFQNGAVEVAGQQKPPFLVYFGPVRAPGCPHGPNGRYRRVNHELGWVKSAITSSIRPSWASARAAAHQNFDLDPTSGHSLRVPRLKLLYGCVNRASGSVKSVVGCSIRAPRASARGIIECLPSIIIPRKC